jgi:hypothetical protein
MAHTALVTGPTRGLDMRDGAAAGEGLRVFAGQYLPEWPAWANWGARYGDRLVMVPLDVASDESVAAAAAWWPSTPPVSI